MGLANITSYLFLNIEKNEYMVKSDEFLGDVFHDLASHKESVIEEGAFDARPCAYVD